MELENRKCKKGAMDAIADIKGKKLAVIDMGKCHLGLIRLPDNSFIIVLHGKTFGA
jgi:hypothetical protein